MREGRGGKRFKELKSRNEGREKKEEWKGKKEGEREGREKVGRETQGGEGGGRGVIRTCIIYFVLSIPGKRRPSRSPQ